MEALQGEGGIRPGDIAFFKVNQTPISLILCNSCATPVTHPHTQSSHLTYIHHSIHHSIQGIREICDRTGALMIVDEVNPPHLPVTPHAHLSMYFTLSSLHHIVNPSFDDIPHALYVV